MYYFLRIVLSLSLFCSYGLILWNTFSARLASVFVSPQLMFFLFLLQEHFWIISCLLAGIILLSMLSNKYLKGFIVTAVSVLLFTEILDCALVQLLNVRFSPQQIADFGFSFFTFIPFIKSYLFSKVGLYTVLLTISWTGVCILAWKHKLKKDFCKSLGVICVLGFVWYLLPAAINTADRVQLYDWPRAWFFSRQSFSEQEKQVEKFNLTYQCQQGLNTKKNIIIVLVESLSAYMSHYFSNGQVNNWTPQLDKLAQKHTAHKHYHATNYETVQSLFSILTGFPTFHYFSPRNLYKDPKFYQRPLPTIFHQAGYHTAFITSASLVYSKGDVLENVHFDEISKSNDPFYNGEKRFVFQSVSDEVLYKRAKHWLNTYHQKKPFLMVLETTTTHAPFADPESGEESLEKAARYADQSLGDFIEYLTEKDFLKNTIVIITADHRSMTPLSEKETNLFGSTAESHIPLLILGSPLPTIQDTNFSHLDLAPSLEFLALPQACFHSFQKNMFSTEIAGNPCTLYQSSIEQNKVFATCQSQHAKFKLAKTSTYLSDGELSEKEENSLLSFINWIRDNNRH